MTAVTVLFEPGKPGNRPFILQYDTQPTRLSGPLSLADTAAELRAGGLTDGDTLRGLILKAIADGTADHS